MPTPGTTRRYARLQGNALVEVFRPRGTAQPDAALSLACPSPETGAAKTLISRGEVVEAAGIEPGSKSPKSPENKGGDS